MTVRASRAAARLRRLARRRASARPRRLALRRGRASWRVARRSPSAATSAASAPTRSTTSCSARLLEAAHQAPSVGLMQPWRFVVVRSEATKAAMQGLVARERLIQAEHLDERARHYLDLKIEGIREAPVSVCVCCDREPGKEILGRHTIRDTDLYSTCLAIENLWLAARAEGVGVGWVSFYREDDVRDLLGIPPHVVPVAWLCIGYPDERPSRPGLEAAGWGRRHELARPRLRGALGCRRPRAGAASGLPRRPTSPRPSRAPGARSRVVAARSPRRSCPATRAAGDPRPRRLRRARQAARQPRGARDAARALGRRDRRRRRSSRPPGSSCSPPITASPGTASASTRRGSARQVAGAAARGETAIGVLARALGAELVVADVGLRGPQAAGVRDLPRRRRKRRHHGRPGADRARSCAQRSRPATQLGDELADRARGARARRDRDRQHDRRRGPARRRSPACHRRRSAGAAPASTRRASSASAQSSRPRCAVNRPNPATRSTACAALGGLELAALVGAMLGGRRTPARGPARRLRDRRRGARRLPAPACAARLPDRRPPLGRAGPRPRAHRARTRAVARPAPAARRGERRGARATADRARRAGPRRDEPLRRGGRRASTPVTCRRSIVTL